jgi:hypothetical protein
MVIIGNNESDHISGARMLCACIEVFFPMNLLNKKKDLHIFL